MTEHLHTRCRVMQAIVALLLTQCQDRLGHLASLVTRVSLAQSPCWTRTLLCRPLWGHQDPRATLDLKDLQEIEAVEGSQARQADRANQVRYNLIWL